LRFNIDPEENATDEDILELLDRAGLTHLTTRETNRSKGKSSPKKNGDTQE